MSFKQHLLLQVTKRAQNKPRQVKLGAILMSSMQMWRFEMFR